MRLPKWEFKVVFTLSLTSLLGAGISFVVGNPIPFILLLLIGVLSLGVMDSDD